MISGDIDALHQFSLVCIYNVCKKNMSESLFVYSSENVYTMTANVYPVNTNVTIDGRG